MRGGGEGGLEDGEVLIFDKDVGSSWQDQTELTNNNNKRRISGTEEGDDLIKIRDSSTPSRRALL